MIRVGDFVENAEYEKVDCSEEAGVLRKKTTLHEFLGNKWSVIVTHKSFIHPVFVTELDALSRLKKEFSKREIKVMVVVPDEVASLQTFRKDSSMLFKDPPDLDFEIVADESGMFSREIKLLRAEAAEMKGLKLKRRAAENMIPTVLVVDPFKRVRWKSTFPECVGRNFQELIRSIDALKLVSEHEVACPSNWANGEDVFINGHVTEKKAATLFSRGVIFIKPWLRLTPMPTDRDVAYRKRAEEKERERILGRSDLGGGGGGAS